MELWFCGHRCFVLSWGPPTSCWTDLYCCGKVNDTRFRFLSLVTRGHPVLTILRNVEELHSYHHYIVVTMVTVVWFLRIATMSLVTYEGQRSRIRPKDRCLYKPRAKSFTAVVWNDSISHQKTIGIQYKVWLANYGKNIIMIILINIKITMINYSLTLESFLIYLCLNILLPFPIISIHIVCVCVILWAIQNKALKSRPLIVNNWLFQIICFLEIVWSNNWITIKMKLIAQHYSK